MKLDRLYVRASFAGEDLAWTELSGVFVDVDFAGANLTGAKLNGKFVCSSFEGADLTGADLSDGLFVATDTERAVRRSSVPAHGLSQSDWQPVSVGDQHSRA